MAAPARRLALAALVGVLSMLAGLGLAGCGGGADPQVDPSPTLPEGAITLQQNIPTPVAGGEVVAYNISPGAAWLSTSADGAEAIRHNVETGDTFTVGSAEYTVHEIGADEARADAPPGAGSGFVIVVPTS